MECHGGNIYKLSRQRGISEYDVIDFSSSINPLGTPESVIDEINRFSKHLYNYPDPEAMQLTETLAEHLSINPDSIICGNGSTELIYLIVRAFKPKTTLIQAPTFSEYERACSLLNSSIRYFPLTEQNGFLLNIDVYINWMKGSEISFICNPNNPTGRLIRRDDMLRIADGARWAKCYLIVDEAFMDFCADETLVRDVINNPYLIVLRSMTKFYALAGIRLGYAIFPLNVINKIKEYKEPWTVNTLAQRAGISAINDRTYIEESLKIMVQEKEFLESEFIRLAIDYIPSEANYYLLRLKKAMEVIQFLKEKGIMVRDCSNFRGLDNTYIRISVKTNELNTLLIKELSNIIK